MLRQWHRWMGITGALLLIFAGTTGTIVAFTEFFGPEEKLREQTRNLESPVTVASAETAWRDPLQHALSTVAQQAPAQPVDKITIEFKGEHPRVQVFTGKPGGGEDRKFTIDEKTGSLINVEAYADKPFLYRLHSGEASVMADSSWRCSGASLSSCSAARACGSTSRCGSPIARA